MIPYDVREDIFEMVDRVLSHVIPTYQYQFNELNIKLDYLWVDQIVQSEMKISMKDKAIWYLSLEEIGIKALEKGFIDEIELEDIQIYVRLGIKP